MSSLDSKNISILVVEDDEPLATIINRKLRQLGVDAETVGGGTEAVAELQRKAYDLALVDVGLPGMSGIDVVKRTREAGIATPMIIITNHISKNQEITSYDSGANIFHRKPIDFDLLESQIMGLVKLHMPRSDVTIGKLQLEGDKRMLRVDKVEHKLSFKEFQLIKLLMNNPEKVFSREQVIRFTFKGVYEPQPSSVDTLVSRLRKKLDPDDPESIIATVHGMGFKLGQKYLS